MRLRKQLINAVLIQLRGVMRVRWQGIGVEKIIDAIGFLDELVGH
jgi:hypothetical protein